MCKNLGGVVFFRPASLSQHKSAQHQLQRTAAMPLVGKRGLPEIVQSFMRVSPIPPLPLSHSVGQLVDPEGQ